MLCSKQFGFYDTKWRFISLDDKILLQTNNEASVYVDVILWVPFSEKSFFCGSYQVKKRETRCVSGRYTPDI